MLGAVFRPPRDIKAATAIHPTQILDEQSDVWRKPWFRRQLFATSVG